MRWASGPAWRSTRRRPPSVLEEILPDVELVLVMTVNPGFGGQKFIAEHASQDPPGAADDRRCSATDCELEVDGGIEPHTAPLVVEAGARVLVAGSAVFHAPGGATAGIGRLAEELNRQAQPIV